MRGFDRLGALLLGLFCLGAAILALPRAARASGAQPPSTVFLGELLPGLGENARQLEAFNHARIDENSAALAAQRADVEKQANLAYDDQDWPKAASLYRERVGLGDAGHPSLWLRFATSLSREQPGGSDTVEAAAFIAYRQNQAQGGNPATAKRALLLIAAALHAQGNETARNKLLSAMQRAWPDDGIIREKLVESLKATEVRVTRVTVHANRFPTDACIALNATLSAAPDFHPEDWVGFSPALKPAAVTDQGGDLCIAGLPAGRTTTVILRAGLPLQAGITLPSETRVPVTVPDRKPQLIADTGHYLIPASSPAAIGVSTVNLDRVRLTIVRVSERSLSGFFDNHPLFDPTSYQSSLGGDYGRTVWEGEAEIPQFVSNRLIHSVINLPDVMKQPGLYAIEIRPGPGLPNGDDLTTIQLVLRTDMAPIVWQGWNGMTVQIRKFTDATPYTGVTVDLIAADNAILGTARTDADGIASFAAPLLAGENSQAPAALHITGPDGDFTVFNLTGSPLDLSGLGISGRRVANRIDPYLWLDRGIYRPGEVVHVAALYRSASGTPLDLPLHVIVRRPGGQVYLDRVAPRADDASVSLPVTLPDAAQAGNWTVSLALGTDKSALASRSFTVAAFVPAKLKVSLGEPAPLTAGKINSWPVNVRFLYGAPGAQLTGDVTLRLVANNAPFPQWKDYSFGLSDEIFRSPLVRLTIPETNAQGDTSIPLDLTNPPDTTHPLAAKLDVSINDPSGRAVDAAITLPVTPDKPLIGIKENFADGTVANQATPGFSLAAVAPSGKAVPMTVTVELVRQETEWHIYFNGSMPRWAVTHINRPVESRTITLAGDKPTVFTAPVLDWGRYRLRVVEAKGGFAASSVIFYAGFATTANPAEPQRLSVRSDQRDYAPGDVAKLHVSAPFHGPATLIIANNAVLSVRNFTLPAEGTTLNVPVDAAWGPGAYAIVEAFRRPGTGGGVAATQPDRAIGLTWLAVKPGSRKIDVSIPTLPLYRPDRDITLDVHAAPGAHVTLAAVDEGILQLTDFANPDPVGHFFGKRRLGVSVMDDYAALLLPPSGQAALLKNGNGGNFGPAAKPIPQRVVSLFVGPVQTGADGVARITLHVPEFNGELRLMAVAWKGDAVGAAHADIIVRDRVIADALLPRFLAPGDEADMGVMLQNLDLPDGRFTATLAASGPLSFAGKTSATLELTHGARHMVPFRLDAADTVGTGHVSLDLSGPNYSLKRDWTLTVHSARAPVTRLAASSIAPGASRTIGPDDAGLYPGSVHSIVTLGNSLPFDPASYMQALSANTLPFLTQSVSRGLPLTVLSGPAAGPDPRGRLAHAVEQVLDLQRFDGSFGLWSSHDPSEPWLTAYATEFLLRARKAGAYVPDVQINQALSWLRNEVVQQNNSNFSQIYGAYVLALAGQPPAGAIRVLAQGAEKLDMPLSRAQLGAALNDIGEPDRAGDTLNAALAIHNRLTGDWWFLDRDWQNAFGSPLRDAWAVPAVIAQSGLLGDRAPLLRAELPGKGISADTLNAQELAWALFADGVLGAPPEPMDFRMGSREVKASAAVSEPLRAPVAIDNLAATALAVSVATTGIPSTPVQAEQHGMVVERRFYTLAGDPLDPSKLAQNTRFIMVVAGRSVDSAPHRAIVDAGLPAGWELAGSISSGKTEAVRWLGTLSMPRVVAAADDRYEAAFDLAPHDSNFFGEDNGVDREFRVAVMLRAVTPGHFTLPGVTLSDMAHPMVFARTAGGDVTVLAPAADGQPAHP